MTIAPCRALARFRHREKIMRTRYSNRGELPPGFHGECCQPDPPRETGEVVTREWEMHATSTSSATITATGASWGERK